MTQTPANGEQNTTDTPAQPVAAPNKISDGKKTNFFKKIWVRWAAFAVFLFAFNRTANWGMSAFSKTETGSSFVYYLKSFFPQNKAHVPNQKANFISGLPENPSEMPFYNAIKSETEECFGDQKSVMVFWKDHLAGKSISYLQLFDGVTFTDVNGKSVTNQRENKKILAKILLENDQKQKTFYNYKTGKNEKHESTCYCTGSYQTGITMVWLEQLTAPSADGYPYDMFAVYHEFGHALVFSNKVPLAQHHIEPHAQTYDIMRYLQKTYRDNPDEFDRAVAFAQRRSQLLSQAEFYNPSAISETRTSYYTDPVFRALMQNDAALARQIIRDNQSATPLQMSNICAGLVKQYLPDHAATKSVFTDLSKLHPAIAALEQSDTGKNADTPVEITYFRGILSGQIKPPFTVKPQHRQYLQNMIDGYNDKQAAYKYYVQSHQNASR